MVSDMDQTFHSYEEEIPRIPNVTCHCPVTATSSILIGHDEGNIWPDSLQARQ